MSYPGIAFLDLVLFLVFLILKGTVSSALTNKIWFMLTVMSLTLTSEFSTWVNRSCTSCLLILSGNKCWWSLFYFTIFVLSVLLTFWPSLISVSCNKWFCIPQQSLAISILCTPEKMGQTQSPQRHGVLWTAWVSLLDNQQLFHVMLWLSLYLCPDQFYH